MECRPIDNQRAMAIRVAIGFLLLAIGAVVLLTYPEWDDAAIVPDGARTESSTLSSLF